MGSVPADAVVEPGSLLVAAPSMSDPQFRRTVVFVLEHRDEGTLGLVLNRPSDVTVDEVLPKWSSHVVEPRSVFVGGPVEKSAALCLGALKTRAGASQIPGLISVHDMVALVDLDTNPTSLSLKMRGLRIFAGYAGWDSGQLADELHRDDWLVVPGLPADVLADPHQDLWAHVLRRQGMPTALLATYPGDPQRN